MGWMDDWYSDDDNSGGLLGSLFDEDSSSDSGIMDLVDRNSDDDGLLDWFWDDNADVDSNFWDSYEFDDSDESAWGDNWGEMFSMDSAGGKEKSSSWLSSDMVDTLLGVGSGLLQGWLQSRKPTAKRSGGGGGGRGPQTAATKSLPVGTRK